MSLEKELSKYEDHVSLVCMFRRQAAKTPDRTAVVSDCGRRYSFSELDDVTEVLAKYLAVKGVVRGSHVGIYMERCIEYVVAYIAILKAGGAYMPLDVSYPESLLQDIFNDAKPPCVVTSTAMVGRIKGANCYVVCLDDTWVERITKSDCDVTLPEVNLDDLAYVVYSSGTTGKPKGILCNHRGAVFSYTWRHLVSPFEADDRVACNVFFVWEMLRSLLKGIPMYVIPDSTIYDPVLLSAFIKRHAVTTVLFTPSLLETVLDAQINMEDLKSLRVIWFCGEVVTSTLLERCEKLLSWVQIFNLYSISECHDVATSDLTSYLKNGAKRGKFAPVGKIAPGVSVAILDEEGNPQPVGVTGEIYVGGPTLARGYLNRPEMNMKRFITSRSGERLYRTGDWGLMKSDRNLEICGRCDSMVKIRGYSIEVQAVEAALMDLPLVASCVVIAVGEEGEDKHLVAYVVPESDDVTKKGVREMLRTKLPFYMIPSYFVFMKSIPVHAASGKLDKSSLPPPTPSHSCSQEQRSSEWEEFLEESWRKVLNLRNVDRNESFFDLGGHSLLAAKLLGKIREKYECDVTMQVLFAHPTISELAAWIERGTKSQDENLVTSSPPVDLHAEVRGHGVGPANLDIQLRAFWRSTRFSRGVKRGRVLLTGSTGFLGAFLLKELLLNTKSEIYCLVRRSPDKSGLDRVRQNLEFYEILKKNGSDDLRKQFSKRVQPLVGDVALVQLGLAEEDYTYLSYEIDYVIHAAAYVNLLYPYEALKAGNVTGTQNVMIFARAGKIKPLHYVSTNSVFPNGKILVKEEPVSDPSSLENGYSQSKWVAEQLLLDAIEQGLPVSIYRIGNISGDSVAGGWNPSDFILLVLRACIMTSSWPDVTWPIEATPVDFVSRSIVKLAQDGGRSVHKIFHLVQPRVVDGRALREMLVESTNYDLPLVSFDEWCSRVGELPEGKYLTPDGHPNVRAMLQYVTSQRDPGLFSYNTTYDQTNFQSFLDKEGCKYPTVTSQLIKCYVTGLTRRNVIPPQPSLSGGKLSGKVAIVTGASAGIGRAIAIHVAREGAKVCMGARSVTALQEVKDVIESEGGHATFLKCDVTIREEVFALARHAEATYHESVSVLVNNAGVMKYTRMSSLMMDDWDLMIAVNCRGVTNGVGAVLAGMIERKAGHIVNISSDAGVVGFPGLSVYSGTKFFVEGISQGLRHEVKDHGIKVTCIEPGDVKTEITSSNADQEAVKEYDQSKAGHKILDPDDVARGVVYVITQPDHVAINRLLIEPKMAPI